MRPTFFSDLLHSACKQLSHPDLGLTAIIWNGVMTCFAWGFAKVTHGNWFNGTDEDCYSAFFTLHPTSHPGFEKGFPNTTTAQCYNIWEGLGGAVGKGSSSADWPLASRQVFNEHPALLGQVHYYYL